MNLDELLLRLRISWVWFQVLKLSLRQDEANKSTMMPQQEKTELNSIAKEVILEYVLLPLN